MKRRKNEMFDYVPNTKWTDLTPSIEWRPATHWAINFYAGVRTGMRWFDEGIPMPKWDDRETTDYSGDTHFGGDGFRNCSAPSIAIYRHYRSKTDPEGKIISCFLSYPNAMGAWSDFFWEIYSIGKVCLFEDVERFGSEEELNIRLIELLSDKVVDKAYLKRKEILYRKF